MSVRKLSLSDGRKMPWRNGGGMTTELAVEPTNEPAFSFRVSVADVSASGPFSRFLGYDRHIVVIDGDGMRLDCGEHGAFELTRGAPVTFSGDWDTHGELDSGPVRDFNVMVKRTYARSSFAVRTLDETATLECPAGTLLVVHLLDGAVDGASLNDTWIADSPLSLTPTPRARVAIARLDLL